MLSQPPCGIVLLAFTLLPGIGYPLAVTGIAAGDLSRPGGRQPSRAAKGKVMGSALIGQSFTRPEYFHRRPVGGRRDGYDAAGSSGSNLGPPNKNAGRSRGRWAKGLEAADPGAVPADASPPRARASIRTSRRPVRWCRCRASRRPAILPQKTRSARW